MGTEASPRAGRTFIRGYNAALRERRPERLLGAGMLACYAMTVLLLPAFLRWGAVGAPPEG